MNDRNGFIFHGGCIGCENPLSVCPDCRYMLPDWNLPDKNTVSPEREKARKRMISLARLSKMENGG